jgi:hypothetical protein
LSAQICSLSENSAELCLVTITGSDHASFTPAGASARRLPGPVASRCATVIAAEPLKPGFPGKRGQYAVVEPRTRWPSAPRRGPNASSGSPLDTMPFST